MHCFSRSAVFTALIFALILAAGVSSGAWFLSRFMLKVQKETERSVTVKGVAEKAVRADLATFECVISCRAKTAPEGFAKLSALNEVMQKQFADLGFSPEEQTDTSINYSEIMKSIETKEGNKVKVTSVFSHYNFTRRYQIRSQKVEKVADAVIKLYALAAKGIEIKVEAPSYFISDPEQYKLELVDTASRAGRQRAESIAATCNAKIDTLLSARQGVIQIIRPASSDSSDYGTYDTSSISKVIRMVMTLTFGMK